MRVLILLALYAVPVLGFPGQSESRAQKADPISGTWTAAEDANAVLKLKFDGKDKVSGTVGTPEGPAPIETGTYHPRTGALKLEGQAKGPEGKAVPYVIQGTLAKGVLTGTWQFGESKGEFKMQRQPSKPGAPGGKPKS